MDSNPKPEKMTLPEWHQTLADLQQIIRLIEDIAAQNPEDNLIRITLKRALNILKIIKAADQKAFLRYAKELGAKVQQADYPHSIKTWYEDDFIHLLEEYGDEQ